MLQVFKEVKEAGGKFDDGFRRHYGQTAPGAVSRTDIQNTRSQTAACVYPSSSTAIQDDHQCAAKCFRFSRRSSKARKPRSSSIAQNKMYLEDLTFETAEAKAAWN